MKVAQWITVKTFENYILLYFKGIFLSIFPKLKPIFPKLIYRKVVRISRNIFKIVDPFSFANNYLPLVN